MSNLNFPNMKKAFLLSLTIIMLIMAGNSSFGQVNPNNPNYQQMKSQGLIPQPTQVSPVEPVTPILPVANPKVGGLLIPLDGTFTLAMGPNDDGSTGMITLPFTFCFYGTNETQCWINNNGNVSFGGPYFDYSPSGFPYNGYPMLAAFWGDVDTRACGQVWYRMEPNRMVVIWDATGYYAYHCNLLNTFELIMTDGTDPLIGVGKNVAFSYTTMQWTTGDASGGSGGFGGYPATVGCNKGDGVAYALVSRFDHPGNDFGGPGGLSGVSYLDDKLYTFDACQQTIIIPPQGVPVSSWWALIVLGVALLGFGTFYILRLKG